MLSAFLVYALFAWGCFEGLRRPWVGLIVYYAFVTLEPDWNWRWSIDTTFPYQKYITGCLLLGMFLSGLKKSKVTGLTKYSLYSLAAFVAIAYVSAFQSLNPDYSFRYMGVIWKVVLMAIITVWLIDTPHKLWILMWVVVLCQGYNAYQINLQYFQDGYCRYAINGWGNKGDNNVYSIFTIPIMGISAALSVYGRNNWQLLLAGGVFVMQLHVLMLLESRGTMIGGIFLAAIFAVCVPKSRRVWSMLAAAFLCAVLLAGPSVVDEFTSAFKSEGARDSSADSRFELWKAGAIITKDHAMFGVGPNAGRFVVPQFVDAEGRDQKALHNLFFEISTGCGLPATLLYLAFFGLIFFPCLSLLRREMNRLPDWAAASTLAVVCGIPGYWLSSMFSSGALLESSYLLVAIGGVALQVYQRVHVAEPAIQSIKDSENDLSIVPNVSANTCENNSSIDGLNPTRPQFGLE